MAIRRCVTGLVIGKDRVERRYDSMNQWCIYFEMSVVHVSSSSPAGLFFSVFMIEMQARL